MNAPPQNKLLPIKSSDQIFEMINNARNKNSTLLVWRLGGDNKITTQVHIKLIRKSRREMELLPGIEINKLKKIIAGRENVNFYLPDEAILFQSNIKGFDDKMNLRVSLPEMVAQVDRRKQLRLFMDDTTSFNIQFKKSYQQHRTHTQAFSKNCYDLSAGGLSFIVSKMEQKFFKPNDDFLVKMNVENREIEVNVKIINIIPIEPNSNNKLVYSGAKICTQFQNLSPDVKNLLQIFVLKYVNIDNASLK